MTHRSHCSVIYLKTVPASLKFRIPCVLVFSTSSFEAFLSAVDGKPFSKRKSTMTKNCRALHFLIDQASDFKLEVIENHLKSGG
jgi:hypothetical protein